MKNTIFMQIAEIICPYYCISCAKVGGILCERCKKYIISQHSNKCLVCGGDLVNNQCFACDLPFLKQFYVGNREDILRKLINIYKYDSVRVCGRVLADLLNEIGDYGDMCVVPLSTISGHIRERGFDHIDLLVKKFVRMNACTRSRALIRGNNAVQVGTSEAKRAEQAKTAYIPKDNIDRDANYLLIDDVWTTGSSMMAACNALQKVGCKNINIAVIAKSG